MYKKFKKIIFIFLMLMPMIGLSQPASKTTFTNPVLSFGPDPWVYQHNGMYYYTNTMQDQVQIWRTKDITDLRNAETKVVWNAMDDNMRTSWAPEIHRIDGKWYIYVSSIEKKFNHHQIYVLENDCEDPFEGKFEMKGRLLTTRENRIAIDASVFEHDNQLYVIWSDHFFKSDNALWQCISIARMKNPWTVDSEPVILSAPEYDWEKHYKKPANQSTRKAPIYVNEGPQVLMSRDGQYVHIVYSASGCWTPYYELGLITAKTHSNLMDPASWTKSPEPVFRQSADAGVYSTGHNGFFKSPDGKEDYIIYHARDVKYAPEGGDPVGLRSPRIQKFEWNNGYPVFGTPSPVWVRLPKPSGTER